MNHYVFWLFSIILSLLPQILFTDNWGLTPSNLHEFSSSLFIYSAIAIISASVGRKNDLLKRFFPSLATASFLLLGLTCFGLIGAPNATLPVAGVLVILSIISSFFVTAWLHKFTDGDSDAEIEQSEKIIQDLEDANKNLELTNNELYTKYYNLTKKNDFLVSEMKELHKRLRSLETQVQKKPLPNSGTINNPNSDPSFQEPSSNKAPSSLKNSLSDIDETSVAPREDILGENYIDENLDDDAAQKGKSK